MRDQGAHSCSDGRHRRSWYWPSTMLREFAAVFIRYRVVNLVICSALALAPVAHAVAERI
jgi:hypothetical protein